MIPQEIDIERTKVFKVILICSGILLAIGLAMIYFNLLIGIIVFIFGFGALCFSWGVANTMVRFEKYYNKKDGKEVVR